jgi:hypothetical protein
MHICVWVGGLCSLLLCVVLCVLFSRHPIFETKGPGTVGRITLFGDRQRWGGGDCGRINLCIILGGHRVWELVRQWSNMRRGCLRTGCCGEYLDSSGRKRQEALEISVMKSFFIFTPRQLILGRSNEGGVISGTCSTRGRAEECTKILV